MTDLNTSDQIETGLGELEVTNRQLKHLGFEMIKADRDNYLWEMDIFLMSALHRAMCLNSGFCSMIREKNFICAAPLVRLQLDNLLRISAAWLVEKPHEFAHNFLMGKEIRKMKDRQGVLMNDSYLVKMLAGEYPWVKRLYEETSGYVHLSDKHLYNSTIAANVSELQMAAYPHDIAIPDSARLEAIKAMFEINVANYQYIYGWKESKAQRPDVVGVDQ